MREEKQKPASAKGTKPAADRLADALRDNLKRRKAQARAKPSEPESAKRTKPEKQQD